MKTTSEFRAILHQAKLKATPTRLAVLSLLQKATKPLSIKEIEAKIDSTDTATIYRMLESFKEAGIVRAIDFQKGFAFFELNDKNDHHHIVCNSCGRIEDFVADGEGKLFKQVLKKSKYFTQINDHSLELFGLCKNCN